MQRKITLHGRSSHSITLPHEWVKKHSLSKGDPVEISVDSNKVIVSTEHDIETEKIEISGDSEIATGIIAALYKSGFDEIRVINPRDRERIRTFVRDELIGFEAITEGEVTMVLRDVSKPDYREFDRILKRSFQMIISAGEDIIDASGCNDSSSMRKVERNDENLNRLTAFLLRALNKKEEIRRKPSAAYTIVVSLEKIGDSYKDLSRKMASSCDRDAVDILRELNIFFREFYTLFYKFSIQGYDAFQGKRNSLLKKIEDYAPKDPAAALCLYRIFNYTYDMKGQLLIEKLEPEHPV